MNASDFYTAPRSKEGVKVPLLTPAGKETGEWIKIIGPDSDAFHSAVAEFQRGIAEIGGLSGDEKELRSAELLLAYRMSLCCGWSFDDEFTPENVREFLINAPRVAVKVESVAADICHFFGPASTDSSPGQSSSSESGQEALDLQPNG